MPECRSTSTTTARRRCATGTPDGAKDLILGQFDHGKIRLYPNLGPDTAPVFNGYTFFQSGGVDITLPYG